MKILCIIPARSGSKSLINKNIIDFCGIPLLAHSINHAKNSRYINRIIVSTDSKEYRDIALNYGAEVPFLRPNELSRDSSLDIDVFNHVIESLENQENYNPDIVVQLRPTYPIRNVYDIDKMIEHLINNHEADSIRSVVRSTETPFKMWFIENNYLVPVINSDFEYYNSNRQSLRETFTQNGSIDVIRVETIKTKKSMTGDKIISYLMDEDYDIDTIDDFIRSEKKLLVSSSPLIYGFDIDDLFEYENKLKRSHIKADGSIINLINRLYDSDNKIIIFARKSKIDLDNTKPEIKSKLRDLGLRYHELSFNNPEVDIYIANKSMLVRELQRIIKKEVFHGNL